MKEKQFIQKIMTDVKVAVLCDDNFTNKGLFGQKWADSKHPRNRGSTMYRTSIVFHNPDINSLGLGRSFGTAIGQLTSTQSLRYSSSTQTPQQLCHHLRNTTLV